MHKFNIIDCHNHSLPNIDDGAEDIEMALQMLRVAEQCGTTDIILTPHHLNGAFSNEATKVVESVKSLEREADKLDIKVNLHSGSEVHLVSETADHIISKKALTYCGLGKAALIELPKNSIPSGVERILSELIYNEIVPVIAHPERNSSLRKDLTPLREWIEFGCKSQLTGQSCTGDFGSNLQEISFNMIEQGLVHIVASDAHRPTGRNPDLSKAADILVTTFGVDVAKLLLHDNPNRILHGEEPLNANTLGFKKRVTKNVIKRAKGKPKQNRHKKSLLQRLIDFK